MTENMQRIRLLLISGFLLLLSLGFVLTRGDAQPNTLKQIAPGIWFREGDLQHVGHCNNIIIEMKDYLIVVDANFPSGARAPWRTPRRSRPKPVKYVFDTHHHGDHAYGNAVWTQAGATTLAYKGVAEEMKRNEPAAGRPPPKQRQDVREMNRPERRAARSRLSTITRTCSRTARAASNFYFFGWAHTRGDGFVYLPKEQILCTGDAVANGPHNYTGDGNIGNWPT